MLARLACTDDGAPDEAWQIPVYENASDQVTSPKVRCIKRGSEMHGRNERDATVRWQAKNGEIACGTRTT